MVELTNMQANFSQVSARLNSHAREAASAVQALSSGERITRAGDDVASLSVSTQLSSRQAAFRSAEINLAQASSLLQVADGALAEITNLFQRMSALSVMANSALTTADRGFLDLEFQQLKTEADRMLQETEFNGVKLFADNRRAYTIETNFTPVSGVAGLNLSPPDGAVIHLNPSDPTTVFDGAGRDATDPLFNDTDVRRITDVSGNGNDVQQNNAGERPDYVTDINGSDGDGIRFDGSNDRMLGNVPTTTRELTTFIVYTRTGGGGTREFLFEFGSNGENSRDIVGSTGTQPIYLNLPPGGAAGEVPISPNIAFNDYALIATETNIDNLRVHVNGTQTFDATLPGGRDRDPSSAFTFGDDSTSGDETTGIIAELIAYERVLTDDERQVVEGYLADKFNLNLPPAHPYASGAVLPPVQLEGKANPIEFGVRADDVLGRIRLSSGADIEQFTILNGNTDIAFYIDQRSGELRVLNPDNLKQNRYSLQIQARVASGDTATIRADIDLGYVGLTFQSDADSRDIFDVRIEETAISDLLSDTSINVQTQEAAQQAFDVLQTAIDRTTALRATVGAKQAQAGFVSTSIAQRATSEAFALGVVQDTDIASYATQFASTLAKGQAGVAVLSQANALHRETIITLLSNLGDDVLNSALLNAA